LRQSTPQEVRKNRRYPPPASRIKGHATQRTVHLS
jgi:hypothetical protein